MLELIEKEYISGTLVCVNYVDGYFGYAFLYFNCQCTFCGLNNDQMAYSYIPE